MYGARELTKKGLLGKDDVYRAFARHWIDPQTNELVYRHIFFMFVRKQFQIERSEQKHPRLNAMALRGMAEVFMVWGASPEYEIPVYGETVRNAVPPRPRFDRDPYRVDRFPSIRITPDGVEYLKEVWHEWITEYNLQNPVLPHEREQRRRRNRRRH